MTDQFTLTTADPRFNPTEPVTISGYLYMPADGAQAGQRQPTFSHGRRNKVVAERPRRRLVEHG